MVTDPFLHLDDLPEANPVPGFRVRLVHTDHVTIAYWDIDAGAVLPLHSHPQEQVTTLVLGMLELTVGKETRLLRAGAVAVVAGDVPHSGRAITPCRVIDVFHPTRDDYRKFSA
jgi:quercetin dioxygenase-like cupin family protein